MPLIPCPDCAREVSSLAPSCPQCGRPMAPAPAAEPLNSEKHDENPTLPPLLAKIAAAGPAPETTSPPAQAAVLADTSRVPADVRGGAGNVLAALASCFVPGLGQLVQGRVLSAVAWGLMAIVAWIAAIVVGAVTMGLGLLLIPGYHLFCVYDAATWSPSRD
jgi:hypothetical protein